MKSEFWRSLEELAGDAEFQALVEQEFPHLQTLRGDPMSRRRFLTLMGASLGLAGLTGCPTAAPEQKIVPYVRAPERLVAGQPLYFATAMPLAGFGQGVLVESHEGRPTKIEGNPEHPGSPRPADSPAAAKFGPTSVLAQASILGLYDPDRSRTVTHLGEISSWDAFLAALSSTLAGRGTRLRILTETVTSPSLAHYLARIVNAIPGARWHVYEPINRENIARGSRLALRRENGAGAVPAAAESFEPQYRLDRANVILSLDADFLSCGPAHLLHHQQFATRRRHRRADRDRPMNRLYVIESSVTTTGAVADHRLAVKPSEVEQIACALAARIDDRFRALEARANLALIARLGPWLNAVAQDLKKQENRGASMVIAGESQSPFVHALAHALNHVLGNVGQTVSYTAAIESKPSERGTLKELADDMAAGNVDVLLILGGNPVYTAPADLDFAARLEQVPPQPGRGFRAHLSTHQDETSALCHWHIPEAHYLESWGDVRAHDGTVSLIQPLIAPLYGGKASLEVLAAVLEPSAASLYDLVRGYWRSIFDPSVRQHRDVRSAWERAGLLNAFTGDFETWWQRALHDGVIAGTRLPAANVVLRDDWLQRAEARGEPAREGMEIAFRPDAAVDDGRFANNGWLQELPRPISKLTWDNAILISPTTAVRLGFAPAERPEQVDGKQAELTYFGRSVTGPLLVAPGHPDDSLTVHLGYGRTRAGRVGNGVGFDACKLRTWNAPSSGIGATLRLTGQMQPLARTQQHHLMENRDLVRAGTPEHPPAMPHPPRRSLTLYNENEHLQAPDQWGMVVDQSLCTGCSACVVACQAENSIPVVGKDQVMRGREMHWLRIDSYYRGDRAQPETYFQPVPCMHCENAPCEVVCPVAATVHTSDGLNDMIYNRCVGTRYCSNNCPYKVRRFNFYEFADWNTDSLRLQRNPEVTVRSRGVMEKCTYCVQRIRAGQIQAGREDRPIRDGEVMTACQTACPAGAIIFGNLTERASKVAAMQEEPYRYGLLEELNTRPRTTYLAAFRNPNPDMPAPVAHASGSPQEVEGGR
jgi:MoCo/4Fe-4S cofactor protein with predicted Tat translocation signal